MRTHFTVLVRQYGYAPIDVELSHNLVLGRGLDTKLVKIGARWHKIDEVVLNTDYDTPYFDQYILLLPMTIDVPFFDANPFWELELRVSELVNDGWSVALARK